MKNGRSTSAPVRISDVAVLMMIILLYAGMEAVGITCPIKFVTGISCAGCGMSRAWRALLLHQDVAAAAAFHPLFWLPVPAVVWYLLRNRIPRKIYRAGVFAAAAGMLLVYGLRMADPVDTIVVFAPKSGLIMRMIGLLKGV